MENAGGSSDSTENGGAATGDNGEGGTALQGTAGEAPYDGSSGQTQGYGGEGATGSGGEGATGSGGEGAGASTPRVDEVCTGDTADNECAACIQQNCSEPCLVCANGACGQEAELFVGCMIDGGGEDEVACVNAATNDTGLIDDQAANDFILCLIPDETNFEKAECWTVCAPLPDDTI
jgi:hypothetical protein